MRSRSRSNEAPGTLFMSRNFLTVAENANVPDDAMVYGFAERAPECRRVLQPSSHLLNQLAFRDDYYGKGRFFH